MLDNAGDKAGSSFAQMFITDVRWGRKPVDTRGTAVKACQRSICCPRSSFNYQADQAKQCLLLRLLHNHLQWHGRFHRPHGFALQFRIARLPTEYGSLHAGVANTDSPHHSFKGMGATAVLSAFCSRGNFGGSWQRLATSLKEQRHSSH
ncbi:unnamed protein product [Symbiodinium natans]|uniref:Uncharacterized protein n=1 Tax=Symbiodinium natans TaxID=878477 RepID=A0A812V2T0_9DINO|nr:unnamed protein product [Symbiodinium natans]